MEKQLFNIKKKNRRKRISSRALDAIVTAHTFITGHSPKMVIKNKKRDEYRAVRIMRKWEEPFFLKKRGNFFAKRWPHR